MFEDLRIVTFSRRSSNDSITTPRVLYANQTLLTRTIPALLTVEVADQKLEEKATFLENAVVPAVSYGYGEDSDLEDYQSDEEESEDDGTTKTPNVHLDAETEGETPASLVAGSDPSQPDTSSPTHSLSEDDENSRTEGADSKESNAAASIPRGAPSPTESESFVSVSPPENATAPPSANHGPQASDVKPKKPRVKTQTASKSRPMVDPAVTRPRSIVVTDIAYRTWRAVLFYAYTHRIAFSPLRSQGVNLAPVDDENDPAQLPICSPKSVYRLAVKYGHTELQQLAMSDIWSKLSTQNVLTELFSSFTSRYPAIQEMELNYVGVYIKHPDIIVRLPAWTDRFARGELKEHADTFGRFIHMLVCAATAAPAGENMCPRGCAMATVQHRCTMCGITFM
ncbi:hypothetical protein C2E23DRAFT_848045 [Lenzites betulinus]|nr:hypothetical protein C2E23DRAFT_848045 [Lenzites betulinus]